MNISCIYQILNIVNNHCYIGSAANYRKRKNKHLSLLQKGTHHCRHLQNAFNAYGNTSFVFNVLEDVPKASHLVERENWWIDKLNPEYNVIREGILNHLGLKRTVGTRLKISRALTGRHLSEETKQKLREISTGKKQSLLTIERKRLGNFKPIIQATLDGDVVREWKSATEAEENGGFNRKCIYRCLWTKRPQHKGFRWSYKISC